MRAERPVVLSARFSKAEERMIERVAARQDLSVSEYLRVAVVMSLVLDGDGEALRYVAGEARVVLLGKLSQVVGLKGAGVSAPA